MLIHVRVCDLWYLGCVSWHDMTEGVQVHVLRHQIMLVNTLSLFKRKVYIYVPLPESYIVCLAGMK